MSQVWGHGGNIAGGGTSRAGSHGLVMWQLYRGQPVATLVEGAHTMQYHGSHISHAPATQWLAGPERGHVLARGAAMAYKSTLSEKEKKERKNLSQDVNAQL